MSKHPFITNSRAVERQAVADLLRAAHPGTIVTYHAMSAAAGSNVRLIRHVISSAQREVRDDGGLVFEAVANVGLRRMTETEIAAAVPGRRRRKIHRQAVTGIRELAGVSDRTNLAPADLLNLNAGEALLGAMAAVSTHRALDRVKGDPGVAAAPLPFAETIALLGHIK